MMIEKARWPSGRGSENGGGERRVGEAWKWETKAQQIIPRSTRDKGADQRSLRWGPRGDRAPRLPGAGAGGAGGLVAPAHGLRAGSNPGFGAGGLLANLVLGLFPV